MNEAGGHRFQRTPPTERRGRVHTSTVTVSVQQPGAVEHQDLKEADFTISWFSGTGKGGQNRNKVQACCRLLHVPSGIEAKAECQTRETSYRDALEVLTRRVHEAATRYAAGAQAASIRAQVGSGMRGDKIRTYRLQDDMVTDHRSGRRVRWADVVKGKLEDLR